MKRYPRFSLVVLCILLLTITALLANHTAANSSQWIEQLPTQPQPGRLQSAAGIQINTQPYQPANPQDNCAQLLVNPALNVLELPGFDSRVDPWVETEPTVYFDNQNYISPPHSLFLADADANDLFRVNNDSFAQAVRMPYNLNYVRFDFYSRTLQANPNDEAYLELYALTNDGNIEEFLGGFFIPEVANWTPFYLELTHPLDMELLSGRILGIYLRSYTDNALPGEWVYFDDITLNVCTPSQPPNPTNAYLPIILKKVGNAAPVCRPALDPPMDDGNTNRGLIELNALCQTSLSPNNDKADFYAFQPKQNGSYTFHLTNLPQGSNWEVIVFTDAAPRQLVPGNNSNGKCATITPGNANETVTCPLQTNAGGYLVMVNAGDTGPAGNYRLRITKP